MISRFILRLLGWKIEGRYPFEILKLVLIVVPHTSNWDFPLGLLVRSALGIPGNFVGKDSLFKPPLGWLMRWLGGIPVDRSQRSHYVEQTVQLYKERKQVCLVIAPEGTRKKVDQLKTGFYHIAKGAGVPILMCKFDWEHKIVGFSDPFYPTNDQEADFKVIYQYFKGVKGKIPEFGWGSYEL